MLRIELRSTPRKLNLIDQQRHGNTKNHPSNRKSQAGYHLTQAFDDMSSCYVLAILG